MKIALLLLSLLFPAWSSAGEVTVSDFSGGLNTETVSILLKDNESPSLQNVVLDETGAITRREGNRKLNPTKLGDGDDDVNAVYQLEQSDGDRYCVAFSSTTGYLSTDFCSTFSVFVSTLTRDNDVNCAAFSDNLYCVNDQYNFLFNGTNDIQFTANPADLDYIQVHQNYCFGAGNDANPSRLYWSNLSDCNTWTVATDFIDINKNDGDILVGIGEPLYGMLPIYKKYSTWVLKGDAPGNWFLVNVSKNTGAKNHRSIHNFNNVQLFDSLGPNGGQAGVYAHDGLTVRNVSRKLRNEIDLASTFRSDAGRKIVDNKDDWDNATFSPMALSSARDPGFMQSSHTAFTDTLAAHFSAGTLVSVSTSDTTNSITLSSTVFQDTFGDNNFTSAPTWTDVSGSWVVTGGVLINSAGSGRIHVANTVSTGSWQFDAVSTPNTGNTIDIKFISNGNALSDPGYGFSVEHGTTKQALYLRRYPGPVALATMNPYEPPNGNDALNTYRITRNSSGNFEVYSSTGGLLLTATDTTYNTSTKLVVNCDSGNCKADNFYFYGYAPSGSWTSRIYDTAISTPIWGLFEATVSSGGPTAITFEVQASTAGDGGGFESLASQSLGIEIVAAKRRYLRTKATITTSISTMTPTISDQSVAAASTGVWTSAELFLSNTINTWGLFQTEDNATGSEASLAYCVRTSTYAGGASRAPCVVVTDGNTITASTGAYVIIIATFTIGVATETAKTDAIVINWKEGTAAKSASSAVFRDRFHYCVQSSTGVVNDTCYVLDNKGAWVKWTGLQPRHLNVVNQRLMMAGSTTTSGGFIYQLYQTDADDGAAISSFWESKDYAATAIENLKSVDRAYLVHSNDDTVLTTTLKADTGLRSKTFSVNLSTGMDFGITHLPVEPVLNGRVFRMRFENNAASKPWEVYGFKMLFRDLGLIQP